MVEKMTAAEKLRAVQLWNILSEKLQEIVNSSAADINALAFQDSSTTNSSTSANFYSEYYSTQTKPLNMIGTPEDSNNGSNEFSSENIFPKTQERETIEGDNSLASFSDIQCAGDEDMDDVCPLNLPLNVEEKCKSNDSNSSTAREKEKTKVFECSQCHLSFRTKGHLLDHSRKHTGERPFLCSDCGSSFTTASNLKRHIKSHSGMKNYACHECQARFLEKKTLLVHMRRHTGEKPYQ
jgi:uncharacterized Zn-finger protein